MIKKDKGFLIVHGKCDTFKKITAKQGQFFVLILIGLLVGYLSTVFWPYGAIILCISVLVGICALKSYLLVLVVLLLCSSSITSADYFPKLPVSWFSLELQDLFLVLLALVVLSFAFVYNRKIKVNKLDAIVTGFIGVALFSFFIALLRGVDLVVSLRQLLIVSAIPVMYWVVRFLGENREEKANLFISYFLWVGFFSACVNILQYILFYVGSDIHLIADDFIRQRIIGNSYDLLMIRTPSQPLLLVSVIIWVHVLLMKNSAKCNFLPNPRVFVMVITFLGFMMEFARHALMGLGVAFCLIIIFQQRKPRLLMRSMLFVGSMVTLFVLLLPDVSGWIMRSFSPSGFLKDTSTHWRLTELSYAFSTFVQNPIFGIGLGGDYRPPIDYIPNPELGLEYTNYIHCAPVWWVVDTGLLGLSVLLFLFIYILKIMFHKAGVKHILSNALIAYWISSLATPDWMGSTAGGVVIGVLLGILSTFSTEK
ncbi:MAG TPA: hypothetical protein DEQ06_01975 [Porphyromonadaceae bacterium]|jgi:hypothetical protein|nr:hypothetical protein [Porphyromonadaceae bacterium]